MEEVAELVNLLADVPIPVEKISYRAAFQCSLKLDPHQATAEQLMQCALDHQLPGAEDLLLSRDGWLDLLLSHLIEPGLGTQGMTFLYDYPASQAALAKISGDSPAVAERFELYLSGIEIANGFHELDDPDEQERRFITENGLREAADRPILPIDEWLIEALTEGLPACSGVALGIDRLLMVLSDSHDISEVVGFDFRRA
jgi:lysyl-tRNA synthetase class 2